MSTKFKSLAREIIFNTQIAKILKKKNPCKEQYQCNDIELIKLKDITQELIKKYNSSCSIIENLQIGCRKYKQTLMNVEAELNQTRSNLAQTTAEKSHLTIQLERIKEEHKLLDNCFKIIGDNKEYAECLMNSQECARILPLDFNPGTTISKRIVNFLVYSTLEKISNLKERIDIHMKIAQELNLLSIKKYEKEKESLDNSKIVNYLKKLLCSMENNWEDSAIRIIETVGKLNIKMTSKWENVLNNPVYGYQKILDKSKEMKKSNENQKILYNEVLTGELELLNSYERKALEDKSALCKCKENLKSELGKIKVPMIKLNTTIKSKPEEKLSLPCPRNNSMMAFKIAIFIAAILLIFRQKFYINF